MGVYLAHICLSQRLKPDSGNRHAKQGITGFDTRTVKFYDGDKAYDIEFSIATLQDGQKVAYAKKFFGYDRELTKKIQTAEARSQQSPLNQQSVSEIKIPQDIENVKYSLNEVTEDGLTMTYVRVPNQNTQNYGSTYGQNIEPAGEYMSMDTMEGKYKIEGYEYGTIQFKKPLVLEHINTGETGWKKTVSDMYNGLTGKRLTKALIKDGYDAIVTYDKYGYSEIVNLNGTKLDNNTKYSVSETTDGRIAAVVDNDILSNIDTSSWDKTKKDTAKKAASDALKQFSDGIVVNGITRKVNQTSRREYTRSKDTESLYKYSKDIFAAKMRAAEIADDIVVAATNWSRDGGLKHPRNDNFVDFDHGTTLIVSGNSKYIAEVVVGITANGDAIFYDVVDMTPTTFDIKMRNPLPPLLRKMRLAICLRIPLVAL